MRYEMSSDNVFTKENLNMYLKELGKEFRKLNGKTMKAEIILIGGASVLANYNFRESTIDVDAVITASSAMKDAINIVGDRFELPTSWLNSDFIKTSSYSPKLIAVSKYYKTFSNVLEIRTVSSEYLVAMKLMAGRKYKNDFSDIVGIIFEQEQNAKPLNLESIQLAFKNLYGDWTNIGTEPRIFIENLFDKRNFEEIYESIKRDETVSRNTLVNFEKHYPNTLKENNANDILETLKKRKANF